MKRGEVGAQPVEFVVCGLGVDLGDRRLAAALVAAVDEKRRACGGELGGEPRPRPSVAPVTRIVC
jgi:hypothetical protein